MAYQEKATMKNEFVSRIVEDPNSPPNVLLLSGFLGDSSEKGCVRLYLDAQFSDYVEIPEEAILHTEELPRDQSPLGGKYVWIRRDAEVVHGPVGFDRLKATFLEGRTQKGYFGTVQWPGPQPVLVVASLPVPIPMPIAASLPLPIPILVAASLPIPIPKPAGAPHPDPIPMPPYVILQRNKQYLLLLREWIAEYAKQVDEALSSMDEQRTVSGE